MSALLLSSKDGFASSVRRLLTGTFLAQMINMAFAPVLTRIYEPEHFGFLALFVSTSMVLSLAASLGYEPGIMLPDDQDQAWTLALLCLFLAAGTSLLALLAMAFQGPALARVLGAPGFVGYLWWVPLGMLFLAANRILEMWLTRRTRYLQLAGLKVGGSTAGALTKLGLGVFATPGAGGLIAGMLACEAGKIAGALPELATLKGRGRFLKAKCLHLLSAYQNFPRYQLWASLLEFAGTVFPVFFMAHAFGPKIVGFYDLGFRMVAIPLELAVHSVRQVFYQNSVVELREKGSLAVLVERTSGRLALVGLVPLVALAAAGGWIFSLVFGPGWTTAGTYAQILSPPLFLRLVAVPVLVFNTLHRQNLYLSWQLFNFAVVCGALYLGSSTGDPRLTVGLLSLGSCLTHASLIYLNLRLARASLRGMLSWTWKRPGRAR